MIFQHFSGLLRRRLRRLRRLRLGRLDLLRQLLTHTLLLHRRSFKVMVLPKKVGQFTGKYWFFLISLGYH
jgi:hypothetical protein